MGFPRLSRAAVRLSLAALLAGCGELAAFDPPIGATEQALRPDDRAPGELPPFFETGVEVEALDSSDGFFRVHYARSGVHAVPAPDRDLDGVPDYVLEVADEYDAVLSFYVDTLGYEAPLDDGDGRFDVYLLDFPSSADGSFRSELCRADQPNRCAGYMVQENDFLGRNYPSRGQATRILASHELFHAVQNAYHGRVSVVLSEGTAVWASEAYDATLDDFEGFAEGYLSTPERSLGQEPSGPVDQFAYGSALFFHYLTERFGSDSIRELWQALSADSAAEPRWIDVLDRILSERHRSSFGDAFEEFVRWNLYTAERADPARSYANGGAYPAVAEQAIELPFADPLVRVFPLAARYYRTRASTAGRLGVQLDRPLDRIPGLAILAARETSAGIAGVESMPATSRALMLEVEAGDTLHVVLLNRRLDGESARPALCVGSEVDLTSCGAAASEGAEPNAADTARPASSGCAVGTQPSALGSALIASLCCLLPRRARRSGHPRVARAGRRPGSDRRAALNA